MKSLLFFELPLFCPNHHIFHCLNIPQNSPNLEYISHLPKKCQNLLSSSISTTRWCYNQGKCVLAYNSYFVTHSKTLYPCVHWIVESSAIDPFLPTIFSRKFAICHKPTFSELLPGNFTYFHQTLHTASVDSWQEVIKRILIFQTILKLLNNNFLYILLKTQSVAYLHIGLSEWH